MPLPAAFLNTLADRARAAGVFAKVRVEQDVLVCDAGASAEPAFYSVSEDAGRVWVALQTPARYLSQSIEADLMFTGDKLPDLIHEEIMDQGYASAIPDAPELPVEHFRSSPPGKLYTFRSPVPVTMDEVGRSAHNAVAITISALLGYEAAFRELGDMTADEE